MANEMTDPIATLRPAEVTIRLPGNVLDGLRCRFLRFNGRHCFAIVEVLEHHEPYRKGDHIRLCNAAAIHARDAAKAAT